MGEEIHTSRFTAADIDRFNHHLRVESDILQDWIKQDNFDKSQLRAGFEVEACLLDENFQASATNDVIIQELNNELVGYELAKFNLEFNSTPQTLSGHGLSRLHMELLNNWQECEGLTRCHDTSLIMIGILPSLKNEQLSLANMSNQQRYRALNREVLHLRKGKPLVLDIHGEEHLRITHRDVMLESAATSFQLHFQTPLSLAARIYNASVILSAPMLAITANSPYLFGKDLWDETRIPLFEMAVSVGGFDAAVHGPVRRVTFGNGYIRNSLFECFAENRDHYPVLLPIEFDEPAENLHHLRFHNGTIWRWNRPLIGIDNAGVPHVRIEHRVIPAGPTIMDAMANAALFYGAAYALAIDEQPPEQLLAFDKAKDNFYQAARLGLRARLKWFNDSSCSVKNLIDEYILPLARRGLLEMGVAKDDIAEYLSVIEARNSGQINGTVWQRNYVKQHACNMEQLVAAYVEQQQSQRPVHEWTL